MVWWFLVWRHWDDGFGGDRVWRMSLGCGVRRGKGEGMVKFELLAGVEMQMWVWRRGGVVGGVWG